MANYTVRAGDTLASIAARFNTSVQALVAANNIVNPNMISIGQQLIIPGGSPVAGGSVGSVTFVVGPGLAQAMTEDRTTPASDEVYVHGNRTQSQWSEAMGRNGTLYRWVQATNVV